MADIEKKLTLSKSPDLVVVGPAGDVPDKCEDDCTPPIEDKSLQKNKCDKNEALHCTHADDSGVVESPATTNKPAKPQYPGKGPVSAIFAVAKDDSLQKPDCKPSVKVQKTPYAKKFQKPAKNASLSTIPKSPNSQKDILEETDETTCSEDKSSYAESSSGSEAPAPRLRSRRRDSVSSEELGDDDVNYTSDEEDSREYESEIEMREKSATSKEISTEQSTPTSAQQEAAKRKDPSYVPRAGAYYFHDLRSEESAEVEDEDEEKTSFASNHPAVASHDRQRSGMLADHWGHDKFVELEQTPRTSKDIVRRYGYDIRKHGLDSPPPSQQEEKTEMDKSQSSIQEEEELLRRRIPNARPRWRGGRRGTGFTQSGPRLRNDPHPGMENRPLGNRRSNQAILPRGADGSVLTQPNPNADSPDDLRKIIQRTVRNTPKSEDSEAGGVFGRNPWLRLNRTKTAVDNRAVAPSNRASGNEKPRPIVRHNDDRNSFSQPRSVGSGDVRMVGNSIRGADGGRRPVRGSYSGARQQPPHPQRGEEAPSCLKDDRPQPVGGAKRYSTNRQSHPAQMSPPTQHGRTTQPAMPPQETLQTPHQQQPPPQQQQQTMVSLDQGGRQNPDYFQSLPPDLVAALLQQHEQNAAFYGGGMGSPMMCQPIPGGYHPVGSPRGCMVQGPLHPNLPPHPSLLAAHQLQASPYHTDEPRAIRRGGGGMPFYPSTTAAPATEGDYLDA